MKYVKPEVAMLGTAVRAIESGEIPKPEEHVLDNELQESNGAYQADE